MQHAANSGSSAGTCCTSSAPPLKRLGHTGPRKVPTNEQHCALRQYWKDDLYGKHTHKEACLWWKEQYSWELNVGTCSDYLGKNWAWLDENNGATLTKYKLSIRRVRNPKWATLEGVLIEWQIRYDKCSKSGTTSGDLLRLKATEF